MGHGLLCSSGGAQGAASLACIIVFVLFIKNSPDGTTQPVKRAVSSNVIMSQRQKEYDKLGTDIKAHLNAQGLELRTLALIGKHDLIKLTNEVHDDVKGLRNLVRLLPERKAEFLHELLPDDQTDSGFRWWDGVACEWVETNQTKFKSCFASTVSNTHMGMRMEKEDAFANIRYIQVLHRTGPILLLTSCCAASLLPQPNVCWLLNRFTRSGVPAGCSLWPGSGWATTHHLTTAVSCPGCCEFISARRIQVLR